MKQIAAFILMCFARSAYAQSSFYIGPSASTGMFWLYNKGDYEGVVYGNGFYKFKALENNMLSFKNYRTGVQFGKVFENQFGFDVDMAFQRCYQEYGEVFYERFDELIIADIRYLSLCLSPSFSFPTNANHFHVSIVPGFALDRQLYYNLTRTVIVHNPEPVNDDYAYGYESSKGEFKSYSNGVLIGSGTNESRYNKMLFGTHLRLNTFITISEKIDLVVSVLSKYMITNTDNLNAKINVDGKQDSHLIWDPNSRIRYIPPRTKSHNIYCGMGLSLVYKFGGGY